MLLNPESIEKGEVKLNFTESEKVFDPEVVYPGFTNPAIIIKRGWINSSLKSFEGLSV